MGGESADFFVSHAGADRAWAEWVAWQLTEAGYSVGLDVWDWAAGRNFVTAMSDALDRCDRVVALFSGAYFDRSRYTTQEWSVSVLHSPGMRDRLVPVRVEDVPAAQMPAMLRPLLFRDVFGVAEEEARRVLLEAVEGPRRPDHGPVFPGRGGAEPSSKFHHPAGAGTVAAAEAGDGDTIWAAAQAVATSASAAPDATPRRPAPRRHQPGLNNLCRPTPYRATS
ncbi:MAG TPA: toll/interleukin-1 receptor domain-containing protein [Streptosporangiaceae bacterium]